MKDTEIQQELSRIYGQISLLNDIKVDLTNKINVLFKDADRLNELLDSAPNSEREAFKAGQETIWEDLAQTVRCPKYDSYEDWKGYSASPDPETRIFSAMQGGTDGG